MTRRTILLLSVTALTVATVLVLWKTRVDRGVGEGRSTAETVRAAAAGPGDGAPTPRPKVPESGALDGEARGRPWLGGSLRGSLLDATSGTPLAGHVVHVTTLGARDAADTGKDGGFELDLDADAWRFGSLVTASVRDPGGKLLLETPVATDASLELRVPPPVRLSGRLACTPAIEYAGRTVTVYTSRADGTTSRLYCGAGALAADGSFAVAVLEPRRPARYLLELATGPGSSHLVSVPRAELVADTGATIERHWAEVALRARDPDGAALADVDVRIAADLHAGRLGVHAGRTDGEGRLSLPLSTGAYTFCATLPAHAPHVGTFDVPPGSTVLGLDVALRPHGDADLLRGVVLSPIEEPLAGALVELRPAVPVAALAPVAVASAHTRDDGRFDLACDSRALLALSAWHPDHGVLERAGITVDERRLRLKFDAAGSARIDVFAAADEPRAGDGIVPATPVQFFVLGADGAVARSGLASAPIRIGALRPGEYEALVLGPGGATYGRAAFRVGPRSERAVRLRLEPAHRARGRVEASAGVPAPGILVEVDHPDWPAPVRSAWGTAVSGPDGAFSVALGAASSAVLAAGDARAVASEGEPLTIRMSAR